MCVCARVLYACVRACVLCVRPMTVNALVPYVYVCMSVCVSCVRRVLLVRVHVRVSSRARARVYVSIYWVVRQSTP